MATMIRKFDGSIDWEIVGALFAFFVIQVIIFGLALCHS